MDAIKAICQEVKRKQSKGKRAHYSKPLIEAIVSQLDNGFSISEMSTKTGISEIKLKRWVKTAPVKIKRWGVSKELRLCFPDGSWIEGLTFEDLRELRDSYDFS